jgi:hypothetical protein
MDEQYYAHYSPTAAKLYGTVIYSTPDGEEVEVTNVYREGQGYFYNWEDKEEIGPVNEYLRQGKRGTAPEMLLAPDFHDSVAYFMSEILRHMGR